MLIELFVTLLWLVAYVAIAVSMQSYFHITSYPAYTFIGGVMGIILISLQRLASGTHKPAHNTARQVPGSEQSYTQIAALLDSIDLSLLESYTLEETADKIRKARQLLPC